MFGGDSHLTIIEFAVFLLYFSIMLRVLLTATLMSKQQQLTIRMDYELYQMAKNKCKTHFGIGLSPLIKIFLRAFVTQRGVGFYVGDDDLRHLFTRWFSKKKAEKGRKGCAAMPGPYLRDIYDL